ncbi:MAG TPA: hypothetical protein VH370_22750 [Humisphaera sp.]|jgi:hypothetical protein|nr:hypothetical protein [Humisphaera sp.]
MAKASKKESDKPAASADKGPKKPVRKAPEAKKPAAPGGMPLIDTGLAAQNAARLVAHRDELANVRTEGAQESSAFKQLKESINKPAAHGPTSFLQNTASQKKSSSPFGGSKQVGRNQTFGADVNRSGVPRRTGG